MRVFRKAVLTCTVLMNCYPAIAGFKYFDPTIESEIPVSLALTGIYSDMAQKKMIVEAIPYSVNSPLWSDSAHKERYILLPPGTAVGFSDSGDYYTYPDYAVFIKNFSLDTLNGKKSSRVLWETRLMINKKKNGFDVWYGFSYKWNSDQLDAMLVSEDGLDTAIGNFYPGKMVDGKPASTKKWTFPKRNQCRLCHVSIAPGAFSPVQPGGNLIRTRSVLGFFTAQINKDIPNVNGSVNQILTLFQKGVFGAQLAPKNISKLPKWRAIEDETASLEVRAKSYIAANCSGCHGTRANLNDVVFGLSGVTNALNYDYHDMAEHMDFKNKALSKDFGNGSSFLLWPGLTDKSTLWYRQSQRNVYDNKFIPAMAQMPPLGSYEVDTLALKVIRRWIDGMPLMTPDPSKASWTVAPLPAPEVPAHLSPKTYIPSKFNPVLRNGLLYFLADQQGEKEIPLSLFSLKGSSIGLRLISKGVYELPKNLENGLYLGSYKGAYFKLQWAEN